MAKWQENLRVYGDSAQLSEVDQSQYADVGSKACTFFKVGRTITVESVCSPELLIPGGYISARRQSGVITSVYIYRSGVTRH
jgi:hypothetical protein